MIRSSKYFFASLIALFACILFTPTTSFSQRALPSCCIAKGNDVSFYTTAAFRAAHVPPLPFTYEAKSGAMITYDTPDGKTANGFLVKSPHASKKYLLVFHEWWGLNDYIKREAERFQSELGDVNVLAVDLFDGKVTADPKEAGKFTQGVDPDRTDAIIKGAIAYAGPSAKIGSIGWCFGGTYSLRAAILAGKQDGGCVIYYGMPEMKASVLESLTAPVLGFFAGKDEWITPAKVKEFEQSMHRAKRQVQTKIYDNAVHAFANPSNPKYDKAAAEDSHKRAIAFLKKNLMKK